MLLFIHPFKIKLEGLFKYKTKAAFLYMQRIGSFLQLGEEYIMGRELIPKDPS